MSAGPEGPRLEGTITQVLPGGNYLVTLEAGPEVMCHASGKLRRFQIRLSVGMNVDVVLSPYHPSRGRVELPAR